MSRQGQAESAAHAAWAPAAAAVSGPCAPAAGYWADRHTRHLGGLTASAGTPLTAAGAIHAACMHVRKKGFTWLLS